MLNRIFAIIFLGIMLAVSVFADQAAYVTKAEAEKAVAFLKDKKQLIHFCAPCEDGKKETEDIQTVEAAPAGYKDFWEVKVNGKGIDLAYVYFQTPKGKWKNLAKELDVKVRDVPKYLPQNGN